MEKLSDYERDGWKRGRKNPIWNKGQTKETNPSVMSISRTKMGHPASEEARRKMSEHHLGRKVPPDKLRIQLSKQYITKKKNHSFNTSTKEEKFYNYLCEQNKTKTIYREYKDDRYPFYCDFYIKEDDLFIECNFHWTHGQHPFDCNNPEDIALLEDWKQRSEKSKYYSAAIETWTIRDTKKLKYLRDNHLNFMIIYPHITITK